MPPTARNPRTGLLYESWGPEGWHNRGWWFDGMHTRGHSGYLAGQSAYYLLKAADWDERLGGTAHPDWVALAGSVVARLNAAKNGDGEYPFILSEETGAGLEYDSMGSAWCLAAAALYAKLTGDRSGLEEMAHSEAHYYEAFVARGECYGGPAGHRQSRGFRGRAGLHPRRAPAARADRRGALPAPPARRAGV